MRASSGKKKDRRSTPLSFSLFEVLLKHESTYDRKRTWITGKEVVEPAELGVPCQQETSRVVELIRIHVIQQVSGPLRMVKDIEGLTCKLETHFLRHTETLHQL